MQIDTKRLSLRPFKLSDAEDILGYLADPKVNCFKSETLTSLEDAQKDALKKSKDDSKIAVVLKDSQKVIGELFCEFKEPDTYFIGWHFNSNYEGKGYATESASAMIHDLFTTQKARRLSAYIEDDNYPSQKLAEKLGMRREGLFLEFISFVTIDGQPKYENTYQYALLKKEWLRQ
ncbi:MAG: GNAT family N-acetyltransferase [Lactococcus plantarum]|nr:GNAT family N-acetyltransferase [Lactococcus plantarum]MDN6070700.1 GNAT family N-acetyltransferase [Lactococcus plantarum]MDN6084029.1 GNAT family N-acetyltransferase [Lactococcus plantarum]